MKKLTMYFFLFLFAGDVFAQNVDIDLLKNINLNRNKSLDPTFKFITNSAIPICIATPIVIYSVGLVKKDSSLKYNAIYIGETILVSALLSTVLKYSVNRDRPFVTYPFIEKVSVGGSPSFPSGHVSLTFASATSLSIAFPKWYVIAPVFLWASAVGYSRMDFGVHYPSDVLAGAIVGSGSAFISYELNKWINKKHGLHH